MKVMVRVALKAVAKNALKFKKAYVWISCEMYLPIDFVTRERNF